MKVLIVDDSTATRFILSKMMKGIGCEVVEADNGVTALEVLGTNEDCEVALVDWNMPVMNGYELIQKIRQESKFDQMKIMMVTTETEMTQVIKALEAGANEYVMKPFTKEIVIDKFKILGVSVQDQDQGV